MDIDNKVIDLLTRELASLVACCTDSYGRPKAPTRHDLERAISLLPKTILSTKGKLQ